jgi:hypothetical protein
MKLRTRTFIWIAALLIIGLLCNVPFIQHVARPDRIALPLLSIVFIIVFEASLLTIAVLAIARRWNPSYRIMLFCSFGLMLLALIFWIISIMDRASSLYDYALAVEKPGWIGNPFQADSVLGHINNPGSESLELTPGIPPIPVRFDSLGFRVPITLKMDTAYMQGPTLLFLGCSFTFGSSVRAEEAFPWLTAQALDGLGFNGGVCSWGCAQMLLRSEELVPLLDPDYVVIQYSPWLVSRSQRGFAPVYFGVLPTPYYTSESIGTVCVSPPPFITRIFESDLDEYRGGERNLLGFFGFLLDVAGRQIVLDDLSLLSFGFREALGITPRRSTDMHEIAFLAYRDLCETCRRNGSIPIIFRITNGEEDPYWQDVLGGVGEGTLVADGETALRKTAGYYNGEAYRQSFWSYAGNPPRMVNMHPNAAAHRVLAGVLTDVIVDARPGGDLSSPGLTVPR